MHGTTPGYFWQPDHQEPDGMCVASSPDCIVVYSAGASVTTANHSPFAVIVVVVGSHGAANTLAALTRTIQHLHLVAAADVAVE